MKRVLIISPYFPPVNAADMQRVRMSLTYFKNFGWECEVVTVDQKYAYLEKDVLLLETIPPDIKIHKIAASDKSWLIGGIAFRSYQSYKKAVSSILMETHFDLIYFSTTQFPLCALGASWKRRFGVPYIIDMQDPWYTGSYPHKNNQRQSLKYSLVYALHRFLEGRAMRQVSGLISVSANYIAALTGAYTGLKQRPTAVIPFGGCQKDFVIAASHQEDFENLLDNTTTNIVYIGRGGFDLHQSIAPLFTALKELPQLHDKIKLYFIGTSYFAEKKLDISIADLARQIGVEQNVVEIPKRIGYFHTLNTLLQADALFIPGSDDAGYNASKIHPYILTKKPILSVSNSKSPALAILKEYGVGAAYDYDNTDDLGELITPFLAAVADGTLAAPCYNTDTINRYSAENLTKQQCALFDAALFNINSV